MEMKGNYHTTDLHITAWLSSNGLELLDIDRRNRQRLDFLFQDRPYPKQSADNEKTRIRLVK